MTEMVGGTPIFGEGPASEEDQLLRIAAFLGPPYIRPRENSANIRRKIDSGEAAKKYPPTTFKMHFSGKPVCQMDDWISFLKSNLIYRASQRTRAINVLSNDVFNSIFKPGVKLPSGNPLPPKLFLFSSEEIRDLSESAFQKLVSKLAKRDKT